MVEVEVFFSGAISNVQAQQPQLVADGTADLATIVPGLTPEQFPDTAIMELPGIYRDAHEASRIFAHLTETGAIRGFDNFFVVGAFVSAAESIHSRKPIASIKDLNGLTIRTNNRTEAAVLEKLGAIPVLLAINQTTEAVSRGKIDGATFPPAMLFEFGTGRVTSNHYMIDLGGAPTALVMNRKKFESLPPQAQAIIRKYSSEWLSERSASGFDALNKKILDQLKSDPRRKVTFPSRADQQRINSVFDLVVGDWASTNHRNFELLGQVRSELATPHSEN